MITPTHSTTWSISVTMLSPVEPAETPTMWESDADVMP